MAAAAAHTWFVTVHPFIDGNGRVARLIMDYMLMRHGYPIAVVTKADRLRYHDALEFAQASDLTPFVVLVVECIEESLEEYEAAAKEQREHIEWVDSLARKFTQRERIRAENEYEVWRDAMALLKSHFQRVVETFGPKAFGFGNLDLRDFGNLDFEKYSALRVRESAKRTWFFRVDFRSGDKSARYLFFFGYASGEMRGRCDVTLHIAREEPAGSYYYERVEHIQSWNVPDLAEVGYQMSEERFVVRMRNGPARARNRVEEFTRQFFEDVVQKDFNE